MGGTLTRDGLVTEICDIVGKSVSASSVSGATLQTRVRTYLNWAQKRIARYHSFHELNALITTAATVADVKRYPLVTGTNNLGLTRPKDISSIRLIDSENSRTLHRWSQRKFDWWYPRPANYTTGRPRIYMRDGNNIEVFRIPNAAYDLSIRYPQWPSDLSSGSQTSDYENKDELLVVAGVWTTYDILQEKEDALLWKGKFLGALKEAIAVEGDIDWEPQAEEHGAKADYVSGTVYDDPYGSPNDPLYGYPE